MELQEDAYRLKQVLPEIAYDQIVNVLRTNVGFANTETRCRVALEYFVNLQQERNTHVINYKEDLQSDFMCLKHILKTVPDEEIKSTLRILGIIPNRKLVAARLLVHQNGSRLTEISETNGTFNTIKTEINTDASGVGQISPMLRKRKKGKPKYETEVDEPSSSKLVKMADSTDSNELTPSNKEHSKIPKLVLKRDRNANEFMVTSLTRSQSLPTSEKLESSVKSERVQEDQGLHKVTTEESMPSSSSFVPGFPANKQTSDERHFLRLGSDNFSESNAKIPIKTEPLIDWLIQKTTPKSNVTEDASKAENDNKFGNFNSNFRSVMREYGSKSTKGANTGIVVKSIGPVVANMASTSRDNARFNDIKQFLFEDPLKKQPFGYGMFNNDINAPGPSRQFGVEEAGPSDAPEEARSTASSLDELLDVMDKVANESSSNDTVIDLSSSFDITATTSTNAPEVIDEPIVVEKLVQNYDVTLPVDENLVLKIREMFPDALPQYIKKLCEGKSWSEQTYAEVVEAILSNESYPRRPERAPPSPEREVDPEEQLRMLQEMLPDADPTYLQKQVERFAGDPDNLAQFIEDALTNKQYPTMKEYLRLQQLSAQQRQYTTEFDRDRFLEIFPDPVAVFEDPTRKSTITNATDVYYVKGFMRNKYRQLYCKDINNIVEKYSTKNVVSIIKDLETCLSKGIVKKQLTGPMTLRPDLQNIPLLQELAYFEHKDQILKHLEAKKTEAAQDREDAKAFGLLQSCTICCDDEVMPLDILTCTGGCRYCKVCIRNYVEVAYGDGKMDFPCFSSDCDAEFSLQVLQAVLTPRLFTKLAQKKAVAEVKAAGLEDLEMCPFCDFATIPAAGDKLFRCFNPDCMKESCRKCKEPSHVPLRCEEVEKDKDIKARTYIENKMTEALIRECWKCAAKFIKVEGCNKMTCSCGAMMCYICREPVKDYKHFNGQGGDRTDLCPLYSDNFSVNEKNVLKAAEEAKKEVDVAQLKNDPTADLQKHFGAQEQEAKRKEAALATMAANVIQINQERLNVIQDYMRVAREQAHVHRRVRAQQAYRALQVPNNIQAPVFPLNDPIRIPLENPPVEPVVRPPVLPAANPNVNRLEVPAVVRQARQPRPLWR